MKLVPKLKKYYILATFHERVNTDNGFVPGVIFYVTRHQFHGEYNGVTIPLGDPRESFRWEDCDYPFRSDEEIPLDPIEVLRMFDGKVPEVLEILRKAQPNGQDDKT